MPRTHELKIWPASFDPLVCGVKAFEYRRNDRGYRAGDTLLLREWSPTSERYTGRCKSFKVTYILYGPEHGVPKGFCVLSLERAALPIPTPETTDEFTIGSYNLSQGRQPGKVYIRESYGLEGGDFSESKLEQVIREFYEEHF